MQINTLKGNMLSLHLCIALDLPNTGTLEAPWDAWECDLIREGREFGPFDTPHADQNPYAWLAIMPTVSRLQLSSRPIGIDSWLVETPDGRSYMARRLIHAYALAIIGCTLGDVLPQWYEDPHFNKKVFLPPLNVEYGQSGPDEGVPTASTFQAPALGAITYGEALELAKSMTTNAQAFKYTCDGHSWVQIHLMDGTVHPLYQGDSTIGLAR
ncbi:hypothetical protein H8F21_13700 [Pseudomonas sp. P66]|uniref:Phage tail protein n=1 Tax=Pseudomonas arcuscaelestis TaxID=2710591 RepID=A0ABS2BYD8_9PSED|nr:hypothetical protein [Pseudomonas arcuscaelestis]MBM5458619.1 hypothetical protein [Pseudomonas arcuscaelestis]